MRKDELIHALVKSGTQANRLARKSAASAKSPRHGKQAAVAATKTNGNGKAGNGNGYAKRDNRTDKKHAKNLRIARIQQKQEALKDISFTANGGKQNQHSEESRDRVVLMVRDPYWLHAYWEINSRSISRARAAMAEQWHAAKPVLRVVKSSPASTTSVSETHERDIPIHGGVNNWYIDVSDPPHSYRVEIGYLAPTGKFFGIARSNRITTPKTNSNDLVDHNWTDVAVNCDKILAQSGAFTEERNDGELQKLFEERLRRPMGSPMMTRYGVGAESVLDRERDFSFEVDAEMIVFGATQPDAHVTIAGEPVRIRHDGTFTVRLSMTEGRQVLPVVSASGDGMRQQTIILAIERNTKTMEPVGRDTE